MEDDYIPCTNYENQSGTSRDEFFLFQHSSNKLYYFAVKNTAGNVLFRSEGYPTPEVREVGIKSVKVNQDFAKNYKIIEQNRCYYVILIAENDEEIARSCPAESQSALLVLFPILAGTYPGYPGPISPSPIVTQSNNRVPAWLWFVVPLLLLGSFFLGKSCTSETIKTITDTVVEKDSSSRFENNFAPISLYFDNNIPVDTISKYDNLFKKYLSKQPLFENKNSKDKSNTNLFFAKAIIGNESLLLLKDSLQTILKNNAVDSAYLLVNAYASPLGTALYDSLLTERRISCVNNFLKDGLRGNYSKLTLKEVAFGKTKADTTVSSDPKNPLQAIYSVAASRERRLDILGIRLFSKHSGKGNTTLVKSDTVIVKGRVYRLKRKQPYPKSK